MRYSLQLPQSIENILDILKRNTSVHIFTLNDKKCDIQKGDISHSQLMSCSQNARNSNVNNGDCTTRSTTHSDGEVLLCSDIPAATILSVPNATVVSAQPRISGTTGNNIANQIRVSSVTRNRGNASQRNYLCHLQNCSSFHFHLVAMNSIIRYLMGASQNSSDNLIVLCPPNFSLLHYGQSKYSIFLILLELL